MLAILQVDHKKGFGGKFGVETDRVDASAKGWSESQKVEAHSSQVLVSTVICAEI